MIRYMTSRLQFRCSTDHSSFAASTLFRLPTPASREKWRHRPTPQTQVWKQLSAHPGEWLPGDGQCSWFAFPDRSTSARLFVVSLRLRAQFGGFLFRRRVAQKIAAADLGAGQVLQQVRTAQRRMKLDVEMESAMIAPVGRRLMQRHHIRKRRSPQVVEFHQKAFERLCEVAQFRLAERSDARARGFWRDEGFVSIAREVGQEN